MNNLSEMSFGNARGLLSLTVSSIFDESLNAMLTEKKQHQPVIPLASISVTLTLAIKNA